MVSYRLLQATLEAIAEQHGHVVDYKSLGQRLHISNQAAKRRVLALKAEGLVLLLPALGKIVGKKRVKRPKLYLRNIGRLSSLIPQSVAEYKKIQGSLIEEIIKQERLRYPSSRFFHYSKYSGLTVDLIVERAEYIFGIQFNLPDSNYMRSHRPICSAVMEGVAKRGFVLHSENLYALDQYCSILKCTAPEESPGLVQRRRHFIYMPPLTSRVTPVI